MVTVSGSRASGYIDAQFLIFSFFTLILIFVNFNFKLQPLTDWFSSPCFHMFALCWLEKENCTAQIFYPFPILTMSRAHFSPFHCHFLYLSLSNFHSKANQKMFLLLQLFVLGDIIRYHFLFPFPLARRVGNMPTFSFFIWLWVTTYELHRSTIVIACRAPALLWTE